MAKVIFILQRKAGSTREDCLSEWSGERHQSVVRRIPGLKKFVQNHVTAEPGEPICDGVGEMWFDSDEAMQNALQSPQMAEAVEDARGFLDMEKTGLVMVSEKTFIG